MKTSGLASHPATPAFLEAAYGVSFVQTEKGLPLFRDARGKHFWGGWGSFYTVCRDEDAQQKTTEAKDVGRRWGLITCCFSTPTKIFPVRHVNILVRIPPGMRIEDRLALYERNIKKHIRNTVTASTLRYDVTSVPPQWHELYRGAMEHYNTSIYPKEWFDLLERSFGEDVRTVVAYDGEKLVGALLCIRNGSYLLLFSIATDPAYRNERIDSGLYDRAICFAIEEGIEIVDFGLTDAKAGSRIAYKTGFGAEVWYVADYTFGNPFLRLVDLAWRAYRSLLRRYTSAASRS